MKLWKVPWFSVPHRSCEVLSLPWLARAEPKDEGLPLPSHAKRGSKPGWFGWFACRASDLTNGFFKGSGLALVPVFNNYATKNRSFPHLQSLGACKLVAFRWWVFGLKANVGFRLPGHAAQAKRWCLGLYCQERWAMPTSCNCHGIQKSWLTISRILAQIDRKITSPMDFSLFFCDENFIFLSSFPVFFIPLNWKSTRSP